MTMQISRVLPAALALTLATDPAAAQHWTRTWAVGVQAPPQSGQNNALPNLRDQTLRQIVRISAGGDQLRLRLSNELTPEDVRLGAVHIAVIGADGAIMAGSDRLVRFSGQAGAIMTANAPLVSDPIALHVAPLSRLAISIHFPDDAPRATFHGYAAATAWLAPGDQTGAAMLQAPVRFASRAVIAAIDVEGSGARHSVVAFGDSITDGARATYDADTRWPDILAERLQKAHKNTAVANVGIGGNRVLRHGAADNALARFDRDALAVPGVSHILVLEGINDIGSLVREKWPTPMSDALIAAFRQMIARAHSNGVRIVFGTLLPFEGARYWSAEGESARQAVNQWIRSNREADGFVDFERAVADPANPARMSAAYDSGDKLHPNDAGFRAMAAAIDLKLLR